MSTNGEMLEAWYQRQVERTKRLYYKRRLKCLKYILWTLLAIGIAIFGLQIYLGISNGEEIAVTLVPGLKVTGISLLVFSPLCLLFGILSVGFSGTVTRHLKKTLNKMSEIEKNEFTKEVHEEPAYYLEHGKEDYFVQLTPHFAMQTKLFYNIISLEAVGSITKQEIRMSQNQGSRYIVCFMDTNNKEVGSLIFEDPSICEEVFGKANEIYQWVELYNIT